MSGQRAIYKVIFAGDGNVGKTSLIRRYCEGMFEQSRVMTIGVDFQTKTVNVDGREIVLSIWDVAGQERFGSFRDAFYRGARAIALVYDVTEPESFSHLTLWRDEIRRIVPGVPMLLSANKVDLEAAVAHAEGERWANTQRMPFLKTSAATGRNVERLFLALAYLAVRFPPE